MFIPQANDTMHKAWLCRVLRAIADDKTLIRRLYFKGGTCAAMLGYLNRFSVDLDFDFMGTKTELIQTRKQLKNIFNKLGLEIKDESKKTIQYFLKYPAPTHERNTIVIDSLFPPPKNNTYAPQYLIEIDRTMYCQTIETMFANKLVAVLDRYEKHASIAGRDIYDIHSFFLQGQKYNQKVIEERRNMSVQKFFDQLMQFIEKNITVSIIQEDINLLLPPDEFQKIRKILKEEILMFLNEEYKRIASR